MNRFSTFVAPTLAVASMALLTIGPANADIVWDVGSVQYTNVNIATGDGLSLTGNIGIGGPTVTFENMIGPLGSQVSMHGANGDATITSLADKNNPSMLTGFSALTFVAQSGTAWTAGSLQLDLLNSSSSGLVTFTGFDSLTHALTTQTEAIQPNGQNQYTFLATEGELITSITFSANMLEDLKHLSLQETAVPAVPEPSTWAMLMLGFACVGFVAYRRKGETIIRLT